MRLQQSGFFKRVPASYAEVSAKIVNDHLRLYPSTKAEIPEVALVKHVFVKASARGNNLSENPLQSARTRATHA